MKVIFFLGNVEEIRSAMLTDHLKQEASSGAEVTNITEELKKNPGALKMRAVEQSFFTDRNIYRFDVSEAETISDNLWDLMIPHINEEENATNILYVSIKSIPAAIKKKLQSPNCISCSGKSPAETGKLYLSSIAGMPNASIPPLMNRVGREVGLLPSIINELRAKYGYDLEDMRVSDTHDNIDSVDLQKAPWDLTDAIDSGRVSDAIRVARLLASSKAGHIGVCVILRKHYSQMVALYASQAKNVDEAVYATAHKGSTYPLQKSLKQAKIEKDKVITKARLCDKAYTQLTGGSRIEPPIVIDILVARLAAMR